MKIIERKIFLREKSKTYISIKSLASQKKKQPKKSKKHFLKG